ncbi:immunoglobulin superfamily member 1-like isoform X2 [Lithobates pipiens]
MSVRKTRPTMMFLRTIISCILLMKETGAVDQLSKPYLEVTTTYSDDAIVIGGMVRFHCKNWTKAETFYLTKDQNENTRSQKNSEFVVEDLKISDSGLYSCKYSSNNVFSEPSEPQYIYVNDKYPAPQITVKPRKIVRPGEDITITCATPYPNVQIAIYKNGAFLKDGDNNPFSYFKGNAGKEDIGQYACDFRTKPGNETQIQSYTSDNIMIKVIGLDSPSAWWEEYGGNNKTAKITCQAPVTPKRMWFQLLNSSEGIEEEIEGVVANQVTFNITSPDHTQKKYYCVYAMKIGSNLAFSAISKPVFIWRVDYTTMNIIRIFISALVLILLGVILVIHFNVFQKTEESLPALPPARRFQAEQSEYAEMVIMNTEPVVEENEMSSAGDKVEEL